MMPIGIPPSHFRETFHAAKAVVVIAIPVPDLPRLETMLPFRSGSNLFVFYGRESPSRHGANTLQPVFRDLFNVTMTYRRDSDIYRPYAFIAPLKEKEGKQMEKTWMG